MFQNLPAPVIVFLVSVIAVVCTTFTANVACATLLLPIAAEMVCFSVDAFQLKWAYCSIDERMSANNVTVL